jgi:hypothetical protein
LGGKEYGMSRGYVSDMADIRADGGDGTRRAAEAAGGDWDAGGEAGGGGCAGRGEEAKVERGVAKHSINGLIFGQIPISISNRMQPLFSLLHFQRQMLS